MQTLSENRSKPMSLKKIEYKTCGWISRVKLSHARYYEPVVLFLVITQLIVSRNKIGPFWDEVHGEKKINTTRDRCKKFGDIRTTYAIN